MSDKAWLFFCAFKIIRQITNLRMQDSDQQTGVADSWGYQRSLSLVSSDRQAGVVELLSLNPSSDHEQLQLYHQLLLWHCWWFFALDFFVFRILILSYCFVIRYAEQISVSPWHKTWIYLLVTLIHQACWTGSASPWKTETNYLSLMNRRFTEQTQWYFLKLKAKLSIYNKFRDIIILSDSSGVGSTHMHNTLSKLD